jgi:DNA ligase (NAD+)
VALEDLQAPAEIKQELRDLARELEAHDNLYYNKDEPQIADAEYDGLAQRLEALERGHLALVQELQAEEGYVSRADRVGAAPSAAAVTVGGAGVEVGARFAPVTHGWPMMSLDNAFSGEDVEAWAVRLEKVLKEEGEEVVVPKEEERAAVTAARPLDFVAEVKIDGVSLSLRYEDGVLVRGATRGNGFVGEDVTANVQAIASIPKRLPSSCFLPPTVMEVRGEVYISRQVFEELNEARAAQGAPLLSNPRNAASGSLRQLNPSLTRERRLGFFAYAAETDTPFSTSSLPSSFSFPTTQGAILTRLEQWGFEVAKPWARCQGTEDLQQFHRRLEGERASLGFDVDGVVYKLDDLPSRATAGRSARAPRWALAHKFSPVEAQTRVRSVEVQVGRTGILTPVALLEPVTVGGVVISRATLHNFQDLARRDVRVGDIVAVRRAGDVIPQVLGRANVTAIEERRPEPVVPPSVCPSCGGPVRVEEDMVGIYCPAGLSCPAQSLERLAHFASRDAFDIKGLGGRRVEELVGWGLLPSGPVDLFHLEEREEAKRKKMKEKIAAAAAGEGGRDGEEEGEKEGVWLLEEREGWGIKSVTALFSAIAARRSVPLSRFIFGLGVTHVGLTTAQAIARHFGSAANWWRAMQELEKEVEVEEEEEEEEDLEEEEVLDEEEADNGDDDDRTAKKKKKAAAKNKPKKKNAVKPNENAGGLETIEGIGPTVIGSLRAFVRDERNRRTVEALMQEVQVTSEGGQGQGDATEGGEAGGMVVPTEGPLVGKTVLFTGTLDSMTRSEAEARARQLGAKPVKTLSKKVDMVVVGVDPGGKVRKARDLGVGLVDEAEWQALVAKASDS